MNEVIIVGRLTRDPEVRYTQSGKAVASFNVAVESGFGENKRADFIPVVVWDKLAEICGNNISKGRKVLVEGRLQINNYEKITIITNIQSNHRRMVRKVKWIQKPLFTYNDKLLC